MRFSIVGLTMAAVAADLRMEFTGRRDARADTAAQADFFRAGNFAADHGGFQKRKSGGLATAASVPRKRRPSQRKVLSVWPAFFPPKTERAGSIGARVSRVTADTG